MIFDQHYLQLCSERTLQTNKEGFFLQFAEAVAENVGEKWIKNDFGRLKTDKERIRRIYEDDKIKHDVIDFLGNVREIYRKKCSQTARNRFLEAEKSLKDGNKQKALNLYNQAVLKSPRTDPILALSLLARGKTLTSLNHFTSGLTSLRLSLKEKIPNNLKAEVFSLMAICHKALNDDSKAQISLNLAEKLITDPELITTLRHNMEEKYEPIRERAPKIPPIIKQHSKIAVKSSPEMGRHVIADEDIETGETLVVEEAEVACLLPEKYGTHCHHCFDRLLAPLGCPDCASVAFCGVECRDFAVSTYHKYECKFLDLLIGSGMSVLSLAALRCVTQKRAEECYQLYENNTKDKMYRLCSNSDRRCLQKSGYFARNEESVVPTEHEYQIGELLLHYLQILQFNAHEIFETLYTPDHKLSTGRLSIIGVAVYPTVSLFNHECHPAVTRFFVGKKIVITSIRPLKFGDLIAENYGPIFTHRNLIERQRSLSGRYWFNCRCRACVENWPLLSNESGFVKRVRCPTRDCPNLFAVSTTVESQCSQCEKKISLSEHIEKLKWCEGEYETAKKLIENNEGEEAIKILSRAIDDFYRVSAPPHRETHLAEAALRLCLGDFGNTYDCLIKAEKN